MKYKNKKEEEEEISLLSEESKSDTNGCDCWELWLNKDRWDKEVRLETLD